MIRRRQYQIFTLILISYTWTTVLSSSNSDIGSWTEGSPLPGTSCHSSSKDCDSENTKMVCLGRPPVCTCKNFYVVAGMNATITRPKFDKSLNACVVRIGEYCETDDPDTYITCEPGTICDEDLVPDQKDVGICVTDNASSALQISHLVAVIPIFVFSFCS